MGVRGALVVALFAAGPVAAQDARVQLDDFSIAAVGGVLPGDVEQVAKSETPVESGAQARDRQVEVAQPGESRDIPVVQLSATGIQPSPQQLVAGQGPSARVPSVSSTEESRPQSVQRLAGNDRCDPQLPEAKRQQCLAIIERRAEEYSAPAAPELTAEQRLMAERQRLESETQGLNGEMRIRLAGLGQPDADLRSNQELAALVLESPQGPPTPTPASPVDAETLADVLQGLSIDIQGATAQQSP